jgi:hypothetical protein
LSEANRLYANNICHAVETYAGGVKRLNERLGIVHDKKWKWSEVSILDGFRLLHSQYGLTPTQVASANKTNRELFNITEKDRLYAKTLVSMAPAYFGKVSAVYRLLGIVTVDVRSLAKARTLAHQR